MNITRELQQLGLTDCEADVYLYLLEHGIASPPELALGTAIARTNCYHVLGRLKERGLIEEQQRGKRKVYVARDPRALLEGLEQKREMVQKLLPDLRGLYSVPKNKPKIRFYEGWEEVKEIYWETTRAEEVRALGSTKRLSDLDSQFLHQYWGLIKKRGVIFYDILTAGSKESMEEFRTILGALYDVSLLPSDYGDIPTDILIWDDNVALIALNEPIFGTVLTNASLAKTFRVILDIMSKKLKNID